MISQRNCNSKVWIPDIFCNGKITTIKIAQLVKNFSKRIIYLLHSRLVSRLLRCIYSFNFLFRYFVHFKYSNRIHFYYLYSTREKMFKFHYKNICTIIFRITPWISWVSTSMNKFAPYMKSYTTSTLLYNTGFYQPSVFSRKFCYRNEI